MGSQTSVQKILIDYDIKRGRKEIPIKYLSLILLFITFLAADIANAVVYGEFIEGTELFANIKKQGDKYILETVSPNKKDGNVKLNDLSPNFNTKERNCGEYFVTGNPYTPRAKACESFKEKEFLNITVDKKNSIMFLNVIVGGGTHTRTGYFNEEKYKKAIDEAFKSIDRKTIIQKCSNLERLYNNLEQKRKSALIEFSNKLNRIQNDYNSIVSNKLKKMIVKPIVQDFSGFYNNSINPGL